MTSNRPGLLQKAITSFKLQNYPNKELVISFLKKDAPSKNVIVDLQNEKLKLMPIEREKGTSFPEARNQAVKKSNGDYVCVWNEDDWYHPSRISYQYNSIQNKGEGYQASILTQIILYDKIKKEAYYSSDYPWKDTLLCRKETFLQHQCFGNGKAQDAQFITSLSSRKQLLLLDQVPFLCIHVPQDKNTRDDERFKSLVTHSHPLKEEELKQITDTLN